MPVVTRTNLCTNPSFEVATTNWATGGSVPPTIATSTVQHQDRTKAMLVTWGTGGSLPLVQTTFTAVIGLQYTVSLYVYIPAGNPNLILNIAGGGNLSGTSTLNDQWQRIKQTLTATSTTVTVQVWPTSAPTSGQICYIDAVLFEQAPLVASYFDGASSGCVWTGTTDLSTSQQLDGPLSITVTNSPTNNPPQNIIYVTGAPGTTCQVTRTDPDGMQRPVRGGDPGTLSTGSWVGFDYEEPYNGVCTYTVIPSDASANAFTTPPALASTQAWLVHPGVPSLSQPISTVQLADDQADSGRALHAPLGRKYPIVITDGAFKSEAFQLGFRTTTAADKAAILALLQDTSVLLLQIVYPFTTASVWRYVSVGHYNKHRVTMQFGDDRRDWTLDVTETDRPAGGIAAQRTWGDFLAEAGTWQAGMNTYKTWTGVVTGVAGT